TVEIFDAARLTHVRSVDGFSDWLAALAFSPEGKHLAAAAKDEVGIVDVASGDRAGAVTSKDITGWVHALAWRREGLYVTGGASPTLWSIVDGGAVLGATWVAKKKGYALSGLAIGASKVAGVAHGGPSTLWDRESRKIVSQPAKNGRAVALSSTGAWLAHLDGKGALTLIDSASGETAAALDLAWPAGDDGMFTCSLAFAPDDGALVCGHAWGVVEVVVAL
ncbi:MAG TPA: hypothetical protein VGO62_07280, partial [Myxococcota bacterium]